MTKTNGMVNSITKQATLACGCMIEDYEHASTCNWLKYCDPHKRLIERWNKEDEA